MFVLCTTGKTRLQRGGKVKAASYTSNNRKEQGSDKKKKEEEDEEGGGGGRGWLGTQSRSLTNNVQPQDRKKYELR